MELRHLRYFVAVAEELHFTRAAARLRIAQPPLTQQIKALERELGAALFERIGRNVGLTNAGLTFLPEARAILAQVESAARKAKEAGAGMIGRLTVGFTESASFHPFVTQALREFQERYPDVDLSLREAPSTDLVAELVAGRLDLAFVRPPFPTHPSVVSELLAHEAMVAALPISHPLARRASISLVDLAQERFIVYPRTIRPGLSDEVIEACRNRGFEPRIAQEAPQLSSTINLVAAGMGVAVVPEGMSHIRSRDVHYAQVEDLRVRAKLALARRADDTSPLTRNFRQRRNAWSPAHPDTSPPPAGMS